MINNIIRLSIFFLICVVVFNLQPTWAATSNINDTNKYAWAENAGWQNFKSTHGGVTVYDTYLEGYIWAENVGWIKLGTGSGPYSNTTGTDWGINHDKMTGNLSGYAWSENTGWINFKPKDGGVSIDTSSFKFTGYAWGENIGWISFQNSSPTPLNPDYYVQQDTTLIVTTQTVTAIGTTTATGNGTIENIGTSNPTNHGICWSTATDPTVSDSIIDKGPTTTTGSYTVNITALSTNTTYYVRAFATDADGTKYGDNIQFTTNSSPPPSPPSPPPSPPSPSPSPPSPPPSVNPIIELCDSTQESIELINIPTDYIPTDYIPKEIVDDVDKIIKDGDRLMILVEETEEVPITDMITVLETFDYTLDLAGKITRTGNIVDIETVIKINSFAGTLAEVIVDTKNVLTEKQKARLLYAASGILESLPSLISSTTHNNGMELIQSVSNLVNSGVEAIFSMKYVSVKNTINLIDNISIIFDALTINTTITANTAIVLEAGTIISSGIIVNLKAGGLFQSELLQITSKLQQEIGYVSQLIFNNMLQNPFPYSDEIVTDEKKTNNYFNNAEIGIDTKKVQKLMNSISFIAIALLKENIPLIQDLIYSVQNVIRGAVNVVTLQVKRDLSLPILETDQNISLKSMLGNSPELINAVLKIAGLNLSQGIPISVEGYLEKTTTLSFMDIVFLVNKLPAPLNSEYQLLERDNIQTPIEVLDAVFAEYVLNYSRVVNSNSGQIRIDLGESKFSTILICQYLISDIFPNGLYFLDDGQFIVIKNGLASLFSSSPVQLNVVANTIASSKDSYKFNSDGTFKILTPTVKYSAVFSYLLKETDTTKVENELLTDNDKFTWDLSGLYNLADPKFVVLMVYPNGTSQAVPPMVFDTKLFSNSLHKNKLNFKIDRFGGLIELENIFFKPDYAVHYLSDDDIAFLDANMDLSGVAWRYLGDINQDEMDDFEMLTKDGRQIFYGVE